MRTYSPQQFADSLKTSHYSDGVTRSMRPGRDGTISVNLADLTTQEKWLARAALGELGQITGLRFAETAGRAQITYVNDGSGANTRTAASGGTITSATVRIAASRVEPGDSHGSHAFRTYMHETAHALGLGHPQDYDAVTSFARSAIANDSWQMSLMSYFDQTENTAVDATKAYNITPMLADYVALRQMYDAPALHQGHTVYGVGSTAGGALDAAARLGARAAFLVADHSGTDHLNLAGLAAAQRIDLTPGAISGVMGAVGNMQIAFDTWIENATGGTGADGITGNALANRLVGGAGNDTIQGRGGSDVIEGGAGNDRLWGEDGDDHLSGGAGHDQLRGGAGNDRLIDAGGANHLDGGAGNDAITGGIHGDTALGGDGADTIMAGAGNDRVSGGEGGDRLFGAEGADTIHGGGGHDVISGAAGDDVMTGGAGNDDLAAGMGSDVLDGGLGNDMMRGGIGRDRFVFNDGLDIIRNFDSAADVIDLRGLAGLDKWSDVDSRLVQSGNDVLLRHGEDVLRIEWARLQDLDASDFLW
mgnify:CR=1 FL=1